METPSPSQTPKSNRNIIIAVVVALALCCCLVALGVAGYYGYKAYVAAQSAVTDLKNYDIPTDIPSQPDLPSGTNEPIAPTLDLGPAPKGGLADDDTRFSAWAALQVVAMISDCPTPTADGTTIKVTSQPDANGAWKEEWTVNCGNGSNKPYNVTFTPENGVVNVNVEIPK